MEPMRAHLTYIRDLDEKIRLIQQKIERGKREAVIRELVSKILARRVGSGWAVPAKNYEAEIKALHDYVRNNVRYTRDTYGIETLQRAVRTLQLQMGDCDDQTILLGSMLQAAGYPVALKVVDTTGAGWSHIYPLVGIPPNQPTRWIAADTTVDHPIGWEPRIVKSRVYPVGGSPAPPMSAADNRVNVPWWAWLALIVALYGFWLAERMG